MLKERTLKNIGPSENFELKLAKRLNLITGDNGLGKSFLLDVMWWCLTRRWPAEINPKLVAGEMAIPSHQDEATIKFKAKSKTTEYTRTSNFLRQEQNWTVKAGRPGNHGLVLYALSDGSFALWDPARNYWLTKNGVDIQTRQPAYIFSPTEIWNGLENEEGKPLCNGLVRDWASWQREDGKAFQRLKRILKHLSPDQDEPLIPGKLKRISLDDARDIPTLKMPYGQEVPVLHVSSGMRRIIALAYILVWAWEEHIQASEIIGQETTNQLVFLIDEIEAHLHPKWQLSVIKALLDVIKSLSSDASVQLITATHSPLVLASVESYFDSKKDAWFDLDFVPDAKEKVQLTQRTFEPQGEVSNWLTSEAFDLKSARDPDIESLLEKASNLLQMSSASQSQVEDAYNDLIRFLNPKDPFLFRWRAIAEKKGFKL